MLSVKRENSKMTLFASPLFSFIQVPNGLEDLLEGLARETLRRQPQNIYLFAAHYCEFLIHSRKQGMTAVNLQQELTPNKIVIVDSYHPYHVQEPDVELPIRQLLQKKKFVPVDLQVYEKTDFQIQENDKKKEKIDKKQNEENINDVTVSKEEPLEQEKENERTESGKRKSLRSIGTQITLIVEDYTDSNNTAVNERQEYSVMEYTQENRKVEKVQSQLSNETVESSTEYTTTQSSETVSDSITDEKIMETSPGSSQETVTDSFSETTQEDTPETDTLIVPEGFEDGNTKSLFNSEPNKKDSNENDIMENALNENERLNIDSKTKESMKETSESNDLLEENVSKSVSEPNLENTELLQNNILKETVDSNPSKLLELNTEKIDNVITNEELISEKPIIEEKIPEPILESSTEEVMPDTYNENTMLDATSEDLINKATISEQASERTSLQTNDEELISEEAFPAVLEPEATAEAISNKLEPKATAEEVISNKLEPNAEEVISNKLPEATAEEVISKELLEATAEEVISNELPEATTEEVISNELLEATAEEVISNELPKATAEEVISKELLEATAEEVISNELPEATTEEVISNELPEATVEEVISNELPEATAEEVISNKLPEATAEEVISNKLPKATAEELISDAVISEAITKELLSGKNISQTTIENIQEVTEKIPEASAEEISELNDIIPTEQTTSESLIETSSIETVLEPAPNSLLTSGRDTSSDTNDNKSEINYQLDSAEMSEDTSAKLQEKANEGISNTAEDTNEDIIDVTADAYPNVKTIADKTESETVMNASPEIIKDEALELNSEINLEAEAKVLENELEEIEELKKLISEGDVEELSKAATKLQSNFRGFKARKEIAPKNSFETVEKLTEPVNKTEIDDSDIKKTEEELEIEELQKLIEEGDTEELSKAATKLQSSFRGFKARKEINTSPGTEVLESENLVKDKKQEESELESSNENQQTNLKVQKTEEELEIEELRKLIAEGNTEELSKAATKLQSNFRGFKTRKGIKLSPNTSEMVEDSPVSSEEKNENSRIEKTEEELEIEELQKLIAEGDTEELSKAATKLQSNFRGFKSRKEIKQLSPSTSKKLELNEDLNSSVGKTTDEDINLETKTAEDDLNPETKTTEDDLNPETKTTNNPEIIKTEEELEIEELQKLIAEGDTEELSKAATKLQSNFRGFKSRKETKLSPNTSQVSEDINSPIPNTKTEEKAVEDDLLDSNEEKKENPKKEKTEEELEIEELQKLIADGDTEELSKAATKLQSNFRGFKSRKETKLSPNTSQVSETINSPIPNTKAEENAVEDDLLDSNEEKKENPKKEKTEEELEIEELQKLIADGDTEELSKAATKLQSNFRGFKSRKETKLSPNTSQVSEDINSPIPNIKTEENVVEDNLLDSNEEKNENPEKEKTEEELEIEELQKLIADGDTEELSKAATKLQSNFRGFKSRKETKLSPNTSQVSEYINSPSPNTKTEENAVEDNSLDSNEEKNENPETVKTEEELEIEELQKLIAEGNTEELSKAATKLQSNFRGFKSRKEIKENITEKKPKSEMDLINKEINKLTQEFQQIKEKKQGTIILQFADEDDNCFKELADIKLNSVDPSEYTIQDEGDILPEIKTQNENTKVKQNKVFDGRKSVELIQMAEEIVENVIEEAVRTSSAMSSKNGIIISEDEQIENNGSDTPISDIIEIVVEVMDYLMDTIAMEFDQTVNQNIETDNVNLDTAQTIEDLITRVTIQVDGTNIDPVVLDVVEDVIDKVVDMNSNQNRNIFPENGDLLEIAFADSEKSLQTFSSEKPKKEVKISDKIENSVINELPSDIRENTENNENNEIIEKPEEITEEIDEINTEISEILFSKDILELDKDDPSIINLEEMVAAPPNSPALLMPIEEVESERLASPDSLDPATTSRIDSTFTPDSLAEPVLRDPLFTPDSISDEPEIQ